MEKRSAPLRHSGLIPYFNTFRVVLKCINQTTMSDVANKTNHIGDDVTFYPSYLCTHCIA